jgi:hypothetical protein
VTDTPGRFHVDRLRLQVQGLDEGAARMLGRLIAENLAHDLRLPVGAGVLDSLKLEVAAQPGATSGELAQRISETVGRALSYRSGGLIS